MPTTSVVQQEMFILYPYLGAKTLVINRHLVLEESLPYHALNYNATNAEIKDA